MNPKPPERLHQIGRDRGKECGTLVAWSPTGRRYGDATTTMIPATGLMVAQEWSADDQGTWQAATATMTLPSSTPPSESQGTALSPQAGYSNLSRDDEFKIVQRAMAGDVLASRWVLANLPLDLFQPQALELLRAQALLPTTAAGRAGRLLGFVLIVIGILLLAGGIRSLAPRFRVPIEGSVTILVIGAIAIFIGVAVRRFRAVEVAVVRGGMRTGRVTRGMAKGLSSHFSEITKEARSRERAATDTRVPPRDNA